MGITLPETNIAMKMVVSNRNLLFQGSIFRGELLVSGRVTEVPLGSIPTNFARVKNAMISKLNDGSLDQVPADGSWTMPITHPGKVKL